MRAVRIVGIAFVAAVVAFVAAQWLWPRGPANAPFPIPPGAVPAAPTSPQAPPLTPTGEMRVAPGGVLEIDAASLEPGKPVAVQLDLADALPSDEPRAVRIVSLDGRVLDAQGLPDAGRQQARVELDSAFLQPGSYMVQINTGVSHFPVSRYVLVVR